MKKYSFILKELFNKVQPKSECIKETKISHSQKLQIWNEFAINSLKYRPPLAKFALLIPSTDATFNSSLVLRAELHETLLPLKKTFTEHYVKPAIEHEVGQLDPETVKIAREKFTIASEAANVFINKVKEYYKIMQQNLDSLLKETKITEFQKLQIWNDIAIDSLKYRPPLAKFALLIPSTDATFNPSPELRALLHDIPLPLQKTFTEQDVKPAIKHEVENIKTAVDKFNIARETANTVIRKIRETP